MPNAGKRAQTAKRPKAKSKRPTVTFDIEFQLHVTGLCAFVPYTDQQGVARMRVVLVDAESPDVLANAMDDAVHTPAILVPDRFLDKGATTRKLTVWFDGRDNNYDPTVWLFPLRQEQLAIQDLDSNDIQYAARPNVYCPPKVKPMDPPPAFGWIQEMPSNYDAMTAAAFSDKYDDVIGRIDLYDGYLSTSMFPNSLKDYQRLLKWYMDTDRGTHGPGGSARAIAEQITFSKKKWPKSTVTISLGGDKIVLQPDQGQIEVWLVNLPLIDIVVNRSKWSSQERAKEHHFHHYYRLGTAVDLIPWPDPDLTNTCDRPTAGVANPRCPPALFAAYHPVKSAPPRKRR